MRIYKCIVVILRCFGIIVSFITISVFCSCQNSDNSQKEAQTNEPSENSLDKNIYNMYCCNRLQTLDENEFHSILKDLCSQELWSARDMYDACNWLMIPMHYAFKSGDDFAVRQFSKLMSSFTSSYLSEEDGFDESSRGNRLQWLYLCSQYLALSSSFSIYHDFFNSDLLKICISQASDNLYRTEATWKTEPTVEEHIKQVLAGKKYKYHYYSSITDADRFTLAILCDAVYSSRELNLLITDEMTNAVNLTYELFASELLNTDLDDGGWLFQVGVLQDNKEFIYAGNMQITEDMKPNPREDIVGDVSHFRRMAFHLSSYESAQETEETKAIFKKRKEQLGTQLKKCIVKMDGNWVQTSFMDGTNGVYRYEYHEDGVGHSGYSHSASLVQGWWVVMYDTWIFKVFEDILNGFPWAQNETNPYWDIITVREQNPYFDCDTAWERGWYKCVLKCAVQLGNRFPSGIIRESD